MLIYRVCARLALLHGKEIWLLTLHLSDLFAYAEMGMLCCINGVNLEDLRENKEIRDIAGVKAVAVLIKKRRLEWYGHVCRKVKKEDLNVDGNRKRKRPKRTMP